MASASSSRFIRLFTAIRENPTVFHSLTGFLLFGGSDWIAQELEYHNHTRKNHNTLLSHNRTNIEKEDDAHQRPPRRFDPWRCCSAGLCGIFFGGFVYPTAYARLDAFFHGTHWQAVVKKSIVEIATVGIFVNSTSMFGRGFLQGRTALEAGDHVLQEMPGVTFNDARVWMPYNILAFSLIPIWIRPATTSLMEACWQTYISLRSNNYTSGGYQASAAKVVQKAEALVHS